jgi:hypothetical protein
MQHPGVNIVAINDPFITPGARSAADGTLRPLPHGVGGRTASPL